MLVILVLYSNNLVFFFGVQNTAYISGFIVELNIYLAICLKNTIGIILIWQHKKIVKILVMLIHMDGDTQN